MAKKIENITNIDLQNMSIKELKKLDRQLSKTSVIDKPTSGGRDECTEHDECPANQYCHSGIQSDGTYGTRLCTGDVGEYCDNNPCGIGDGDCDQHSHCYGDLVCGTDNCPFNDVWGFTNASDCCEPPPIT